VTKPKLFTIPRAGGARPISEPLSRPSRPIGAPRRRISVTLDHDRYVALRTLAATQRLSGDDIVVIALDRLLAGQ